MTERKSYHTDICNCFYEPSRREKVKWNNNKLRYCKIVKRSSSINLIVIGNTPYENDFNGIAFCKDLWKDLLDPQCSGRYLLCALGIDLQKVQKTIKPVKLFMTLAKKGIIFLNQKDKLLQESLSKNVGMVITCGGNIREDIKKKISQVIGNKYKHLERHPSPQGETNPPDKNGNWFKCWGMHRNLLNILEPSGSGPIHTIINDINSKKHG